MSDGLAKLREPFAPNQIGKLPRATSKGDQDRGPCEPGSKYSADGVFCGGFHTRAIHLDFVGHAALTDRLLDTDDEWTWEPLALGPDGLPVFDAFGGLWIRLTVLGVTRLGYGDAQGKDGGNAVKEAIGDALRNGAMRFGAALDLWHKGDLHEAESAPDASEAPRTAKPPRQPAQPPQAAIAPQQSTQDWFELAKKCTNFDELKDLYSQVEAAGELGIPIAPGRPPIGQFLWELKDSMKAGQS